MQPFLEEIRAARGAPNFCRHMEFVVMGAPGAAEILELRRKQFRSAAKARAAAAERQPATS